MWNHLLQVEQDRVLARLSKISLHQEQKEEISAKDLPDPGKEQDAGA